MVQTIHGCTEWFYLNFTSLFVLIRLLKHLVQLIIVLQTTGGFHLMAGMSTVLLAATPREEWLRVSTASHLA